MKKSLFLVPLFVIFCLFVSCGSTPVVFDDSLSDDSVAIIYFQGGSINIIEYNGITVEWKSPGLGSLEIKIPGGNTQFVFNGTTGTVNMGYTTYRQVPFRFNFENGKVYTLGINQNMVYVFNGKSTRTRDHLATYNMSRGQTLIMQDGKRVN